ncbi:hypothetical protein [Yoonia sp. 2307UL14-13]|uniref:hypothetical protein n=1 Tax=Yoonia sp. 2307UL14-13 TaxID=3126506 RepID=UPI0030B352E3
MPDDKTEKVDDLRPTAEELKRQQRKARQTGAHPMDRPADPAEHMDEDEAKGRTLRDLDKRPD